MWKDLNARFAAAVTAMAVVFGFMAASPVLAGSCPQQNGDGSIQCAGSNEYCGSTCIAPSAEPVCSAPKSLNCGSCSCVCPAGTVDCGATCVSTSSLSCSPGQTPDYCAGACTGSAYVVLNPASAQAGGTTITGTIAGGALTATGNIQSTGGDLYLNNGKAVRVDGSGVTTLNLGNWGGGATGFNVGLYGKLGVGTGTPDAAVKVHVAGGGLGFDNGQGIWGKSSAGIMSNLMFLDATDKLHIRGLAGGFQIDDSGGLSKVFMSNGGDVSMGGNLQSSDDIFTISTYTPSFYRSRMEFTESEIRVGRYLNNMDFGNSTFIIEGGENSTVGTFDIATLGFANDSNRSGQASAPIASIVGYTDAAEGVNTGWLKFRTKDGTTLADRMSITPSGNVGINNPNPGYKLTVGGTFFVGAAGAGFNAVPSSSWAISANSLPGGGAIYAQSPDAGTTAVYGRANNTGTTGVQGDAVAAGSFGIYGSSSNASGIGGYFKNTAGGEALHIDSGTFKIVPGAGAGKVLTSDAAGLASWQTQTVGPAISGTPAGGQLTYWTSPSAVGGDAATFWDATNKRLVLGVGQASGGTRAEFQKGIVRVIDNATGYVDIDPWVGGNGESITFTDTGVAKGNIYYNRGSGNFLVNSVTPATNTVLNLNGGSVLVGEGASTLAAGAKFEVKDGISVFQGGYTGPTLTDVPNNTYMMMWYPLKIAFRAGGVDGGNPDAWDDINIGEYSIGLGLGTKAKGNFSVALGFNNNATGAASTVTGQYNTASGYAATAIGGDNTSSGTYATSIGYLNTAYGGYSLAYGYGSESDADYSVAGGYYAYTGSGGYSVALGRWANTGGGSDAIAIGYNTGAWGPGGVSIGYNATNRSNYGAAIGRNVDIWGSTNNYGFGANIGATSGYSNTVTIGVGNGSYIYNNVANSIMLGMNSNIPTVTITGGNGINGTYGSVGIGTTTPSSRLDIRGGDINMDGSTTIYSRGRMHIDGEEILYLLNQSGVIISKAWGGTGNLTVDGTEYVGGNGGYNVDFTTRGRLRSGDSTGGGNGNNGGMWVDNVSQRFMGACDTAQCIGFYNADGWSLRLLNGFGDVYVGSDSFSYFNSLGPAYKPGGGSWAASSDRRVKKDIYDFDDGLDVVRAIRPVNFTYNGLDGQPEGMKSIGVIAQEIQEVAPYTVSNKRGSEYLQFDPSALMFVNINAIKELDKKDGDLESEIEELRERIRVLEAQR